MSNICVYIPTYNRNNLLVRAIKSVIDQTEKVHEIIVINDCKKNHVELIGLLNKEFSDAEGLKLLLNQHTKGACGARNTAINHAKATFITGLDDDDYFLPNHIENLMNNFTDDYAFVSPNYLIKGSSGSLRRLYGNSRNVSRQNFFYGNVVGNQFFTYRKRLIEIGGFDEALPSAQDVDVMARLLIYGNCRRLKEATYVQDVSHDLPRITTSNRKVEGMKMFQKKHFDKMNKFQRLGLHFKIMRLEKKMSLPRVSVFVYFYLIMSALLRL